MGENRIRNFEQYREATLQALDTMKKQDYEKALGQFLEMAEYNRDNYKVREMLVLVYLKLDRLEDAEREYKNALTLMNKNRKEGDRLKIRTFEEMVETLGDFDQLEQEYRNNIKQFKQGESGLRGSCLPVQLSMHYSAWGDYKKAEELLLEHRKKVGTG